MGSIVMFPSGSIENRFPVRTPDLVLHDMPVGENSTDGLVGVLAKQIEPSAVAAIPVGNVVDVSGAAESPKIPV
jgi:hypothetical protein